MKIINIPILTIALFSTISGFGQGQEITGDNSFEASMQLRPRFEYRDGAFHPLSKDETAAALVSSRLRLNMDYQYSDLLKTRVSLQNISLWGQASPVQDINQTNNNLGVFEAWADLKIYKGLRAKIGRQTILLDDQRLFSVADWTQGGRSHDAISVYYGSNKFEGKTFFAFNQNYNARYQGNLHNASGNLYDPQGSQAYKYMQTLWLRYEFSKSSKASFLFANLGFQNADTGLLHPDKTISNLQTTGLNYSFSSQHVQVNLSGYYQFGENTAHETVSAYLVSAGVSGKLSKEFTLALRTDYLSGSKINRSNENNHSFNSLFGTSHPFYGKMDYYPYGEAGLWNNVITLGYKPSQKISLKAAGHFFYTAQKFDRAGKTYGKNLGQEVDLAFDYHLNSLIGISGGYSVYFTTENVLALKGVVNEKPWQNWAWISLDINPRLFKVRF